VAHEFVRTRLCDFSLRCFEEKASLPKNGRSKLPAAYVACVAQGYPAKPFFAPFATKARAAGWAYTEIDSGHDCHVEKPQDVARFLLDLAR
jgi:hypothetical protein